MATLKEALQRRRNKERGLIWADAVLYRDAEEQQPWLYLGSGQDASNLEQLRSHAITHVLNVADDVPNFHKGAEGLSYCSLQVGDFGTDTGISRVFQDAFTFVESCRESHGIMLVHCANGSNRSCAVVTAICMNIFDWPLQRALDHVVARHPATIILVDNITQLRHWEAAQSEIKREH